MVPVVFPRVHARSLIGDVLITRSKLEAKRLASRQFLAHSKERKTMSMEAILTFHF